MVKFCLFSAEVDQEFNPPPPSVEYLSTTKKDFSKGGSQNVFAAESELMDLLCCDLLQFA